MAVMTLGQALAKRTREGELFERLPNGRVHCYACGHNCRISDGKPGVCKVRFNAGGRLMVPAGYVGALQCDPVEKKPFFHALPGAAALSFGMLGCDYHCGYCQNWLTSQALRDPEAVVRPRDVTAEELVQLAERAGARIVASTYNEPLITSEWAVEVFRPAKQRGLLTAYISNGNGTPGVLRYLRPWVDLYKVDLKGFNDPSYRKLGGVLQTVLDTICLLVELGFWVEVVTLCVPGFNDSNEELEAIARFLAGVSPDIPWHVTAFHQDYKMTDRENTPLRTLLRAAAIGREVGLRYVYAGNLPGLVGTHENTYCSGCRQLVIERYGFKVLGTALRDGACGSCARAIPGVWSCRDGSVRVNPPERGTRPPERAVTPASPPASAA
ncbi:MAG TPA: AmmeMemoRadiSam system radical SAM enzyme [Candidatus Sulfotelmatobacter sp.]|nr:AmmeMemoRadiSam system radical SAM enzyme [Candidatus Sulfotelmatobacter sp.]